MVYTELHDSTNRSFKYWVRNVFPTDTNYNPDVNYLTLWKPYVKWLKQQLRGLAQ